MFDQKHSQSPQVMSDRAYDRRLRRASGDDLAWYDLPVDQSYLQALRDQGARVRVISRWLNAASIIADDSTLYTIQNLPFVERIVPVAYYTKPLLTMFVGNPVPYRKMTSINYGPSLPQIAMLSVDSLHSAGLSGHGVLVGMMDTGFDTNHPVFARMDSLHQIFITHDFINGDSNVVDSLDIQRGHGTATLSVLGGYGEGNLIGPAYGADFVLAKTEIVLQEIKAEEDYWVAASEWMESLGVEIISSSLGYIDWYDTLQLDGQTALITRAANAANALGVVVVNSAGNEGTNPGWRKITPPSDGDSVIAVGAVDVDGIIVDFSSRGPTADGRIKPDVCALGSGDYVADYYSGGYGYESGTSFSAPLISGSIALLLEGHPDWTLQTVIAALKQSSSRFTRPDNNYGWGIPDMVDVYYRAPFRTPNELAIVIAPHPAVDSVIFHLVLPDRGTASLSVHDVSGAKVFERDTTIYMPETIIEVWNGRNSSGNKIATGVYICVLKMGGSHAREKLFYISE